MLIMLILGLKSKIYYKWLQKYDTRFVPSGGLYRLNKLKECPQRSPL